MTDNEPEDRPDCRSIVKVWSNDGDEEYVSVEYNRDQMPDDTSEKLKRERNAAMLMAEFEATGAKVKETFSWDEARGCYV